MGSNLGTPTAIYLTGAVEWEWGTVINMEVVEWM
jgi:hypothetical protein